jgi:UPF0716 protein FxsA
MALVLALLFLALPVAELALIVTVADGIGVLNTFALLVAVSVVGAWLAKREGLGMLARVRAALDRGEMPSREVADGFLILLAGALMITPGFITDCLAILLLLPPTRAVARRVLLGAVVSRTRMTVISGGGPGVGRRGFGARRSAAEPDVWDAESWEDPPGGFGGRGELGGRS